MESFHPRVVHFPIALLLTAVLLELAAGAFRREGVRRVALWNLALGTLGAGAAVLTGWQAAEIARHSFEIHQVIELHRRVGLATLVLATLVTGWRVWVRDRLSAMGRRVVTLLMLAMVATLIYGAHLGGRLVYEFGVGGSFGVSPAGSPGHHHEHPSP